MTFATGAADSAFDLRAYLAGTTAFSLVTDIETSGFRRAGMQIHCIEAILLPHDGSEPFEIHGADQPGYTSLADMRRLLANARRVIGHNLKVFDLPCLERSCGVIVPTDRIVDTLIASRVLTSDRRELDANDPAMPAELVGRHSLDAWGWRLRVRKDAYQHYQDQPWSPELQQHCALDTIISWALFDHLSEIDAELAA
jgi:hypothetical protein